MLCSEVGLARLSRLQRFVGFPRWQGEKLLSRYPWFCKFAFRLGDRGGGMGEGSKWGILESWNDI